MCPFRAGRKPRSFSASPITKPCGTSRNRPTFRAMLYGGWAPASVACRRGSARRHRLLAAIIVEAALGLAAEPARLDVFNQQRAGPVLGIRQPLVQHLHH